jgi:hypothetical protein
MAAHDDRIRAIRTSFDQALDQLTAHLDALDDHAATKQPADGWSAAQIGWHVALTNDFLSGVLGGGVPDMIVPKPEGFVEQLATMPFPDRVKTFPALEPPADASRAEASARLRASGETFTRALASASPERCATSCVQMPFGAVFSLYELGEFMGAHIERHIGQFDRTLALA